MRQSRASWRKASPNGRLLRAGRGLSGSPARPGVVAAARSGMEAGGDRCRRPARPRPARTRDPNRSARLGRCGPLRQWRIRSPCHGGTRKIIGDPYGGDVNHPHVPPPLDIPDRQTAVPQAGGPVERRFDFERRPWPMRSGLIGRVRLQVRARDAGLDERKRSHPAGLDLAANRQLETAGEQSLDHEPQLVACREAVRARRF